MPPARDSRGRFLPSGKSGVKDTDLGWDAMVKATKDIQDKFITVGVHSNAGTYTHGSGGPVTAAQVATFNEFGTKRRGTGVKRVVNLLLGRGDKHIPARPFMRLAFRDHSATWTKIMGRLAKQVQDGKLTTVRALSILGEQVQGDIQGTVRQAGSWAVPNAPSTIRAKRGGTKPLQDTGTLIKNRIRWQVGSGLKARLASGRSIFRGL